MKKSPLRRGTKQLKRTPFRRKPQNAPKRAKKTRNKREGVSYLKRRLDGVYSVWVRVSAADANGYSMCYTCGVKKPWKELQCGHFVSRAYNQLRFDPRNTKVQCAGCNIFRKGNLDVYAMKLVQEYGAEILNDLNREKQKIKQFSTQELKDLIALYQQKIDRYI